MREGIAGEVTGAGWSGVRMSRVFILGDFWWEGEWEVLGEDDVWFLIRDGNEEGNVGRYRFCFVIMHMLSKYNLYKVDKHIKSVLSIKSIFSIDIFIHFTSLATFISPSPPLKPP